LAYTHIFAGNSFDRGDHERRDEELLKKMIRQANTKLLPFHKLQPLVKRSPDAELAWIGHDFLDGLPEEAGGPKFLGFDEDRNPHFAVDISAVEDPSGIASLASGANFEDGRSAATDIPKLSWRAYAPMPELQFAALSSNRSCRNHARLQGR
jgi:hypothetical protein